MRHFITLLLVCGSIITKAQTTVNKLAGTWELTAFTYKGNTVVPQLHGFKRYKSFTPTHFIVTEVNIETNITTTSIFGTYTLTDSSYTEHLLHVNRESAGMIGGNYSGTIRFDSEDAMAFIGILGGEKMDERWKRVKPEH